MKLRILGARLLVKNYELPETIGSLVVPENYREMYDGKSFECVAVGTRVSETLCVAADLGETVIPALSADIKGAPMTIEPDDIIIMRGTFKGAYSPELSLVYKTPVWFVDVVEIVHDSPTCAIKAVWPSKHWKEEAA